MSENEEAPAASGQPEKWLQRWVCIGRRRIGGKWQIVFIVIGEDGQLGEHKNYEEKAAKKNFATTPRAGFVYELEANGKSAWFGTLKYIGPWENSAERAAWHMEQRAAETREAYRRREKKETGENPFNDLFPYEVRKAYHNALFVEARAMELLVTDALRRWTKEDRERHETEKRRPD